MKKSWIKSLLVLVMAVLLIGSRLACNGDKGAVDDGTFTTAKYFDKLWELTSDIGSGAIAEDDDLALHFGVVLDLSTVNTRSKQKYDNVSLGVDVQAVVGRTEETAPEKTALKV
ncbi:MAG: hypothetical protein K2M36_04970, partial [Clostridia bacterium]|nr:hypothetical protein [Clostridia bacterium]